MMHTVIANAHDADPYDIDTLFLYMSNMAWNSAMNTAGTMDMLTARDEVSGEYRIPRIIYADAYYSEMVAYADLILPDTTYLERWDCISLLDRPISDADGPADAIRQPVVEPDRDVRPFQEVLLELGARLGLPGLVREDGGARYPGGYAEYLVMHERKPGVGMLAGWRGANGDEEGTGAPNPGQLDAYIANGCFWRRKLAPEQRYFKHANRAYLDHAVAMGFLEAAEPITLQLYCEPLQRFRLAARGHGAVQPPEVHRARVETYFDPLPFWYAPFGGSDEDSYPYHAVTQRPAAMYHSWGSHNAWLRQIHGHNRLYVPATMAAAEGLADGDWVWITSRHGRVKGRIRIMEGVNGRTVWTWNAVGRRAGAVNLDPRAPEAREGFLLNHLIEDLLPVDEGGYRYANADPVTGQAAWYDLRVRIEKAAPAEAGEAAPSFAPLARPPRMEAPPATVRAGAPKVRGE
jgi:anaerobic selenocysteine-containing dehydrogenase